MHLFADVLSLPAVAHCGASKNPHGHSKAVPCSRSLAVLARENTEKRSLTFDSLARAVLAPDCGDTPFGTTRR